MTLWGQSWKNAGYPVKAIWASHGRTAVRTRPGQLTVPVVFSTSENDFTVAARRGDPELHAAHNGGTPSEIYVSHERKLNAAQYERIPGIDQEKAKQILFSLVATGVWDGQGNRVDPTSRRRGQGAERDPAASVAPQRSEIDNETP